MRSVISLLLNILPTKSILLLMKSLLYAVVLLLLAAASGFSQSTANSGAIRETIFYAKNGNPDWLTVRAGVQISAADLVRLHKSDLGLNPLDELVLYRTDTDDLGFSHHRYQQYHQGVPVDGGELLVHEQHGRVRTLNGKLVRGLQADVRASVPADAARQRALQQVPAQSYMWESSQAEAMLRRIKNDPTATFYPQPELVLVAPGFTHAPDDFQLAWRMIVHTQEPESRQEVFISAATGAVLEKTNLLCDQNVPGTAVTRYSGERPIITELMPDNQYRLVETTRGSGIETYDMRRGTNFDAAVNFTDDDNHWNNVNIFKDEVATDAHWGAEMTYDYFLHFHDHSGVNGNDMPLVSYVHYGSSVDNAFWNGAWSSFGDGSNPRGPFVSIDIVSHEFTHGVTEFSARLRYRNESGALNESFSDIFGAAVRFWAKPENANWFIGDEINPSGPPIRNMANPKTEGNPSTYKGQFWFTGTGDNGGVHYNSGVQNHWFYLLTEGGSGTNDNGDAYTVTGQGMEVAGAIAYRNLQYYLAVLSNYTDAREGALQAAEDLFGICSEPYVETANAWYAVGLGLPIFQNDVGAAQILEPGNIICDFAGTEPITAQFRYASCNKDLLPGDKIPVAYQINDQPAVWDTLVLTDPLTYNEVVAFTFSAPPAALAVPGLYSIRCWTALDGDTHPANNAVSLELESVVGQDTDVRMQAAQHPASRCFLSAENPQVEVGYWGCAPLPAGTEITLFYTLNGANPVSEVVQTPFDLHTGESFKHTFAEAADLSVPGRYHLNVWAQYAPDAIATNDSLNNLLVLHPAPLIASAVLTFESPLDAPLDSVLITKGTQTKVAIAADAARTGVAGLRISGGDIQEAFGNGTVQVPTLGNVWNLNPDFRSQVCLCADLTGMATAELEFDIRQTFSFYYQKTFGAHAPYGSSVRVLANGQPLGDTYKASTPSFDPWRSRKENLKNFVGGTVQLCFEAHTGISPEQDTFPNSFGDRVLLDNIAIVGQLLTSTNTLGHTAPDWAIAPNPGNGTFTVTVHASKAQSITLHVTDALGRTIRTQTATAGPGQTTIPLRLEGATPGVYFVQLELEQERFTRKILVQH